MDPNTAPVTTKPGIQTTEFWSVLATNVIAVLVLIGLIPTENKAQASEVAMYVIAAVNGLYALARAMVKKSSNEAKATITVATMTAQQANSTTRPVN